MSWANFFRTRFFRCSRVAAAVALTTLAVTATACRNAPEAELSIAPDAVREEVGAPSRLGDGSIHTFATFRSASAAEAPLAIGVVIPDRVLATLPTERSDGHRCFDLDGDGAMSLEGECLPTHERVLPFPSRVSARSDIPFKWMLFNWNPVGHAPPGVFDVGHFDIHYFVDTIENAFALMPGPCGPEMLQCDQFERARIPVPAAYVPGDFQSVDAAAPTMGNHLIDLTGHEFHGGRFDRAWIYGAYDGRITFWEEMVTLDFIRGRPDACFEIKTPQAYEVAGYYPTRACYDFDPERVEHRMSLEGFVYREASSPPMASR